MEFLTFLIGFLLGLWLGAWWAGIAAGVSLADPDVRMSPGHGTAVMLDADGQEVSRRTLHRPMAQFTRYHGHDAAEHFTYLGPNEQGDHVFQVRR